MSKNRIVSFFLILSCYIAGTTALKCNICNSASDETWRICRDPAEYSSRDCSALFPRSRYWVTISGNHTTRRPRPHGALAITETVIGPRRTCQFDLDKYELFDSDLKPGCRNVNITKFNYLAFGYVHFDGHLICLCTEDNCNSGDYRTESAEPEKAGPEVELIRDSFGALFEEEEEAYLDQDTLDDVPPWINPTRT